MNNSIIGNYLCEAVSDDGFFLMHLDRKDYITDKEDNRIVFKTVDKFSSLSGSFTAERAEGGFLLIDDKGDCMNMVFDEIGYENGSDKLYRPAKYTSMGGNPYWAYCIRSNGRMDLLRLNFHISGEDEEIKLGEKLGNGDFFCMEHYPSHDVPYKTLGCNESEITVYKFSSLKCYTGEKEYIIGKELNGNYSVFVQNNYESGYGRIVFSDAPSHTPDGTIWAGRYRENLIFHDFYTRKRSVKKGYKGGKLEYNENLNIFLEYDPIITNTVCNIWDMQWKTDIQGGQIWKEFTHIGRNTYRVVDYKGITRDLSLSELIERQRNFWKEAHVKNTEISFHNRRMLNVVNDELKSMGFNALRKFCKTATFADWTAYYFRTDKVKMADFEMKVIQIALPVVKTEGPALMLIESEQNGKLYVCNRLKTRLDDSLFYLTVLFELTDFPKDIFKDLPSGAKIKVADMFSEEKVSLLEKLTGKKKAPKAEEPKPSIVIPVMQQLRKLDNDNKKHLPSIEVEFDETKYRLTPYEPWEIEKNPFDPHVFLPKANGVFVLLNDSFDNEPMHAFATTEGAFSNLPDYMMEGVGQGGQYAREGNANGHIIIKRKDVYLFYRDEKGILRFFDRATYWGYTEHGSPFRPVLHIYLKSLLRKKC